MKSEITCNDIHSLNRSDILTVLLQTLPKSWIEWNSSVMFKQIRHILVNSFTTSGKSNSAIIGID